MIVKINSTSAFSVILTFFAASAFAESHSITNAVAQELKYSSEAPSIIQSYTSGSIDSHKGMYQYLAQGLGRSPAELAKIKRYVLEFITNKVDNSTPEPGIVYMWPRIFSGDAAIVIFKSSSESTLSESKMIDYSGELLSAIAYMSRASDLKVEDVSQK